MKLPLGAIVAVALLVPGNARVEVIYEQDSELECERVSRGTRTLTSVRLFLGENELPADAIREVIADTEATTEETTIRFRDQFKTVRAGEPLRVQRVFEKLSRARQMGEDTAEHVGTLVGRTLSLERSGGSDVVQATLLASEAEDAPRLDHFRIRPDEEALLPDRAVKPGDSWSPPRKGLERLLGLETRPELFADSAEDPVGELGDFLGRGVDFDVEVVLEGTEMHEGVKCWLLTYELAIEGARQDANPSLLGLDPLELDRIPRASSPPRGRLEVKGKGSGRAWISCEERRFVEAFRTIDVMLTLVVTHATGEVELRLVFEYELAVEGRVRWHRP